MKLPRVPQRTTTGFVFSLVERALQEGIAKRQFGKAEIEQVLAFFGDEPPECVYCGDHNVVRWDHLVPVSRGGETVLGNIVPSCARCDDSKRDIPFDEWMLSDAGHSPKSRQVEDIHRRIERIRAYAQHFGYATRSLEERLNTEESMRLQNIRKNLNEVRKNMEALIADYHARTGEG
ncbi:MAG: HNH endonuclease [Anaerolineae bacterium]|nr:HNH endonuclease [Anaerolineae bacterium]